MNTLQPLTTERRGEKEGGSKERHKGPLSYQVKKEGREEK